MNLSLCKHRYSVAGWCHRQPLKPQGSVYTWSKRGSHASYCFQWQFMTIITFSILSFTSLHRIIVAWPKCFNYVVIMRAYQRFALCPIAIEADKTHTTQYYWYNVHCRSRRYPSLNTKSCRFRLNHPAWNPLLRNTRAAYLVINGKRRRSGRLAANVSRHIYDTLAASKAIKKT